jgi:hypothetical protein
MTTAEWAQFIFFGIGGAFGLLCLFDGTRRLVGGHAGNRGPRLVIGVGIVAILAGHAYWQHQVFASAAMAFRLQRPANELPADWGKKISPAKREAVSQGLARRAFIESGTMTQYVDAAGQRRAYVPAQDDLKQREAGVVAVATIEHKAANAFVEAVLWLILGLSAFVFGLFFALERAAKPAAPAAAEPPA